MKNRSLVLALMAATTSLAAFAQQPPPRMPFPEPTGRAALSEGPIMLERAAKQQNLPDLPGSGPYIATYDEVSDAKITVYAPKDLAAASAQRKLPIYAFGNGGCSYDGAAQRFHLLDIASFGYVVITPGTIQSGPKGPSKSASPQVPGNLNFDPNAPRQTVALLSAAIDWLIAENARAGSSYYNKIDTSRIAVAGGSCGGMLAMSVALEPRIKSLIMFNSGVFPAAMVAAAPPAMRSAFSVTKADLDRLHAPVLYMTGGEEDLAYANARDDFSKITKVAAFWADRPHTGHLGMAFDANAEGTKIAFHWLEYTLFGDRKAGQMFVGKDCSLCRDLVWKVSQRGL